MCAKSTFETSRGENFARSIRSDICLEEASAEQPWLAQRVYWHGYDQLALMQHKSFIEVCWLLLRGELPNPAEAENLNRLFVMLACPSPRHQAVRAVMNAAIAKTYSEHWLPIGLNVAAGEFNGAQEVHGAVQFLQRQIADQSNPDATALTLIAERNSDDEGDWLVAPGFGSQYGCVDERQYLLLQSFASLQHHPVMCWVLDFAAALRSAFAGIRPAGVVATVSLCLGFSATQAMGLFQMAQLPGLLAYACEKSGRPLTDMPFPTDDEYRIRMPNGEVI